MRCCAVEAGCSLSKQVVVYRFARGRSVPGEHDRACTIDPVDLEIALGDGQSTMAWLIVALHDLDLALRIADEAMAVMGGRIIARIALPPRSSPMGS